MQRLHPSARFAPKAPPVLGRRRFLRLLALAGVALVCPAPDVLADARQDARALARRGQELYFAGRYAEAADDLAQAGAAMPRDEWIWGLLGKARFHAGDLAGARDSFHHVLRLSPQDVQARMMLQRISMFATPAPARTGGEGSASRPHVPGEAERRVEEEHARARADALRGGFVLRRLVIDPGHGGGDPGLIRAGAPLEKLATLDLALRLRDLLARTVPTLTVFLTRHDDSATPLAERALLAERMAPDLVLSLHVGDESQAGTGFVVWAEAPSGPKGAAMAAQENAPLGRETARPRSDGGVGDILRRSMRARGAARARVAADALRAGLAGVASLPETQSAPLALASMCAAPCLLLLAPGQGGLDLPEGRVRLAETLAAALAVLHREGA